eukprot:gene4328-6129_t
MTSIPKFLLMKNNVTLEETFSNISDTVASFSGFKKNYNNNNKNNSNSTNEKFKNNIKYDDNLSLIVSDLSGRSDVSFRPDLLTHLSDDILEIYIRLWYCCDDTWGRSTANTPYAFGYYQLFQYLVDIQDNSSSFHILDFVTRNDLLLYVLQSVSINFKQILVTFALVVIIIWIFTVISIYVFGFSSLSFGEGVDWPTELLWAMYQQLDFGFRGAPTFNEYNTQAPWKLIYDLAYQIFIVLILVAIITGIITNTFGMLKDKQVEFDDNVNNVCFICSLTREELARQGIKFKKHITIDHNPVNYLYYKVS